MILLLALLAQPCAGGDPILETAVPITFQNARFAAPRTTCPTTEVALSGGTNLLADLDDFHGDIRASGFLEASFQLQRELAVFVELELVRYQTVIRSLDASDLGFGHTSIGATYLLFPGEITVTGRARLTLPTATGYFDTSRPLAADAALTATTWVLSWLELHAELGMLGSVGLGEGPLLPLGGLSVRIGGTWRPTSWFALIADVSTQLFYASVGDYFAVGGGLRFFVGGVGIDLFAASPLAGHDRTTIAGLLRIRYDFR